MKHLQEKKYKGIKKVVIKNEISLEDYKQGLFSEEEEMKNVNLKAFFFFCLLLLNLIMNAALMNSPKRACPLDSSEH